MNATEFKQQFLPLQRHLFGVAFRLTGDKAEAEDLVQDTYLRLWTRRDRIGGVENVLAYTVSTLRRVAADKSRKAKIATSSLTAANERHIADAPTHHEGLSGEDDFIQTLLRQLPERQQTVLTMRDIEGMEYEDIALATGITEVNLRSILSRARKQLKTLFLHQRK
ncbi:MAG: RNA polymerase sigma factor [Prevotella sp.]